MFKKALLLCTPLLLVMCNSEKVNEETVTESPGEVKYKYVKDAHSFANIEKARTTSLFLDIEINFDEKIISGSANYQIETDGTDTIIFDSKKLDIHKIVLDDKAEVEFSLGTPDELLGTPVYIPLKKGTKKVSVFYSTTSGSEALQWLNPAQTDGKKYPYLFTQGEAILTRSWIPIQDTPGNRITYKAKVKVPQELLVVMSASNPEKKNDTGVYEFEMNQPIPSYLIAMAAGDLEFRSLGKRTGVFTEPSMIESCANELADTEKMLEAAEKLYGAYKWERYDIIVLPPSFPFGGMENPRLTFATPTIIAGDKSLISLIAHEMAHSWSGNLVTNATWDDFWLNEGFTVYFERRIMEELYGREYSEMLAQLGYQDLMDEVEGISQGNPDDTKLKLNLTSRNPDDGMTSIAYEKGAFFLRMLEETAGREKFDAFLTKYFNEHQFQPMTTETFLEYLDVNLVKKYDLTVNVDEWVHGPGIPSNIAVINSSRFIKVDEAIAEWTTGKPATQLKTQNWSTHEWLHFLNNIPQTLSAGQMQDLDNTFHFTQSGNSEILCSWFEISINSKYSKAYGKMEDFLVKVGRRKFLTPLYKALVQTDEGRKMAMDIYEKARPSYHFISTSTIDKIVGYQEIN